MEAMVRVSDKSGKFWSFEEPEQQRVAARMGKAEFLDPLTATLPESLDPPVTMSLGSGYGVWVLSWVWGMWLEGFFGSEGLIERQMHGLNDNANNAIDDSTES